MRLLDRALLSFSSGISPALSLLFAANGTLPGTVTFTRSSSGAYYNSSGVLASASSDVARFHHNPDSLAALGLLIEESRTNANFPSEDAGTTWTTDNLTIVTNQVNGPDGSTNTGDKATPSVTAGTSKRLFNNSQTVSGNNISLSCFVKPNGYTEYALRENAVTGAAAIFTLTGSGSVKGTHLATASSVTGRILALSNGWYWISAGFVFGSSASRAFGLCVLNGSWSSGDPASGSNLYAGNGTSGGYVFGMQCEAAAFSSTYYPTTSGTATRSADVATMTSTNFSSWFDAVAGTFVVEFTTPASGTRTIFACDDNTANEAIILYTSGTDLKFKVVDGGVTQCDITVGTVAANTSYKAACAYKANDFAAVLSGGTVQTDTGGTIPAPDRMRLGASQAGEYLCGTIASLKFYSGRLTNSQMQTLTT